MATARRRHAHTYWTKPGTFTQFLNHEEYANREFNAETRAIQLDHLAKIVSVSTISYRSDTLIEDYMKEETGNA